MKKTMMIAIVALFVMGLIATTSYAWKGAGPGSGGYGYNCPAYGSVDPEKAQKFYNDTTPLRQKMLQLRGELAQLFAQQNPDWDAISQKRQEMAKLKTELQKKAHEYGFGYGYGFGRMGHGGCRCGQGCW